MATNRGMVVSSLSDLSERIVGVVNRVWENYRASTDLYEFIKRGNREGITALYAVSHAYSDCMKRVGVQTRVELEQLWGQHYSDPQVRDAVEAVLEAEEKFAEFVARVEEELVPCENVSVSNDPAIVGQVLPKDLGLLDASSGQPTTLDAYWKESKFTLFVLVRHFG